MRYLAEGENGVEAPSAELSQDKKEKQNQKKKKKAKTETMNSYC